MRSPCHMLAHSNAAVTTLSEEMVSRTLASRIPVTLELLYELI